MSFALLMLITRSLRATPDIVLASSQFAGTFLFGALLAPIGWVTPDFDSLCLFATAGCISVSALLCVNRSLKLAPASVVVPYQYSMIIWAVMFGYAVFGDVPSMATIVGAAIIISAGLYIFLRERNAGARGEGAQSAGRLSRIQQVQRYPLQRQSRYGRMTPCRCVSHRYLRVELAQFFNDDQTLRDRRKQSTGVEEPSASKRCNSTPLHWKPHFSRILRDDGLVTRAPETRCSTSNSSKVKSIIARAASVPKPWPQCSKPNQ